MQIVDTRNGKLRLPSSGKWLVLVTCYPFDALPPGGSERYVVSAQALSDLNQTTLPL